MNLLQTILKEHSSAQTHKIVSWVGPDQKRFDQLMKVFFTGEAIVQQRAAWPISYVVERNPGLAKKHLAAMLKKLKEPKLHNGIIRNLVRLFQFVDIPERLQGQIMELCFNYINDPKEKPAIKSDSLTVLANLAKIHPEISNELILVITSNWDNGTAAFHARAKQVLKVLKIHSSKSKYNS